MKEFIKDFEALLTKYSGVFPRKANGAIDWAAILQILIPIIIAFLQQLKPTPTPTPTPTP